QNPYAPVNYAFVIEDLRDALAESSPDDLDKLLPPDNPQTAQQFFDISPEIRAGMRPYLAIGENVIFIDPINLPTGFISTYVQQDDNDYSLALAMFVSLEADYDGSENVDSTDAAAIEQAVAAASERIAALATSRPDALAGVLQQSFGSRLSPDTRTEFVNLAAARQLPVAERTLFASAEVLAGANGAYASDYGGLILLNDSYRSDAAALPDVVLHEWAHHLDATLDSGDAPGEEGQIFLEGINNGGPIATEDYRRLLASDAGHATLQFEGRTLDVEQWFGSKLWKKAKKFVQKKLPFVAKVVNVVANGAASLAKTVGKTVYAGAQICAAGLAAASGDTAGANAFLNGAANSFKSVAMNALDYVSVAGDLINLTTAAVDSLTPIPFGTIVSVAASFSPIGPYLAANKGIADVKNAIKHKGNVLSAVGFAALDITGSGLSRLGKGLKVARVARAANDANRAGTVAANLTKWQKLKALPGKAKTWLLDTNPLVKARGWEITRGAQFYGETTYKWVDRLKKLNLVVRPKDFIRGRDRNEDGELLGTGGNLWTRHIELCGDYLACARRNKDNKNSNSNASLPQDSPEGDWLIYRNAVINCLPSGCLDSGPDCDTEAVPGQCSFPKNDAARLCEAHGTCLAVTCSDQRNDCQARRATTTESHDDFTSYLLSEDARERASMLQAVRDAGSAVAIQDNETANITEKSNASKAAADVAAKQ
ncbi:MAG: hypothetical protein OEY72_14385, partial [Gammaproteobacteria bacterium]|nr:hypothetical protein [Gammaproteobacteria bacterium]